MSGPKELGALPRQCSDPSILDKLNRDLSKVATLRPMKVPFHGDPSSLLLCGSIPVDMKARTAFLSGPSETKWQYQ